MQVLFLGGPWHGQRHDVIPCRLARGAEALPTQYSVPHTVAGLQDTISAPIEGDNGTMIVKPVRMSPGDRVIYKRRFAHGGGERRPVYVAPDYHGPARA
jgi:hypothetical protein